MGSAAQRLGTWVPSLHYGWGLELGFRLFVTVGAWHLGSALVHCVVRLAMYDESKNLGSVSRTSCPWRFGTWVPSQGICDNEIWNLGSVLRCMMSLRTWVLSRILLSCESRAYSTDLPQTGST